MTTLTADRVERAGARLTREPRPSGAVEGARGAGGGSTLESLLSSVWEDLTARASAACPVCGGEMTVPLGGGVSARCGGCGSELD